MTRIRLPTLSYHSKCCNFSLESFNYLRQSLYASAGPVFRLDPKTGLLATQTTSKNIKQ